MINFVDKFAAAFVCTHKEIYYSSEGSICPTDLFVSTTVKYDTPPPKVNWYNLDDYTIYHSDEGSTMGTNILYLIIKIYDSVQIWYKHTINEHNHGLHKSWCLRTTKKQSLRWVKITLEMHMWLLLWRLKDGYNHIHVYPFLNV